MNVLYVPQAETILSLLKARQVGLDFVFSESNSNRFLLSTRETNGRKNIDERTLTCQSLTLLNFLELMKAGEDFKELVSINWRTRAV
jgi:hypothetical protein